MNYYLFLDECGDHGLSNIDPDFSVFVLCGTLLTEPTYILIVACPMQTIPSLHPVLIK